MGFKGLFTLFQWACVGQVVALVWLSVYLTPGAQELGPSTQVYLPREST